MPGSVRVCSGASPGLLLLWVCSGSRASLGVVLPLLLAVGYCVNQVADSGGVLLWVSLLPLPLIAALLTAYIVPRTHTDIHRHFLYYCASLVSFAVEYCYSRVFFWSSAPVGVVLWRCTAICTACTILICTAIAVFVQSRESRSRCLTDVPPSLYTPGEVGNDPHYNTFRKGD